MRKGHAIFLTIAIVLALGFSLKGFLNSKNPNPSQQTSPAPKASPTPSPVSKPSPVNQADSRITKKPFGIYITPKNSPVQPEKFTGYHTGTDFETFPDETNAAIPFYAICDGKILQKRTATGYGGILVQSCMIENQAATVVYGHVSLKSIVKNIGDTLTASEEVGILGQPPGETDGERKHLHLGIHKGTAVNIKGYVQNQSELSDWLDFQKLH